MLGRKTRNTQSGSHSRDIEVRLDGKVLFSGSLADLPLKEEWIIKKSVEFFNDPEPCFLHRSAVAIRLLNEIWDSETDGAESEYPDYPKGALIFKQTGLPQ